MKPRLLLIGLSLLAGIFTWGVVDTILFATGWKWALVCIPSFIVSAVITALLYKPTYSAFRL